jgi:membrane protease YdiL (CAAX protease family)
LSDNEWVWMDWLQKLIAALVALGLALLLAGRDNRKSLWSACKLPEPSVIIVAAALPVFVTLLPAVAHFLVNRAHWAANDFGKYSPPELLNYLPRPAIWMVGLVFGAFVEEVIFRGVLQQHFVQRYGVWRGIFLVGAVWAAIHFYIRQPVREGRRNVGIFSAHERAYPGSEWNRTPVWLLVVLVLNRFWPIPQPEREESRETAADAQPASARLQAGNLDRIMEYNEDSG